MRRVVIAIYGTISYLFFLVSFVYLIGFVADIVVPKGINGGDSSGSVAMSLLINLFLVAMFGLQHSIMARPAFKQWWTAMVPKPAERSTYVLFASAILAFMMYAWQPIPHVIWNVEGTIVGYVLFGISMLGWAMVLLATFQIDHFHLFGIKQVAYNLLKRRLPSSSFVIRGFYHLVRHPLMLGFLIAFWFTPQMTVGHLQFSMAMTVYILTALKYEERDLIDEMGEQYMSYQRSTPRLNPIRLP